MVSESKVLGWLSFAVAWLIALAAEYSYVKLAIHYGEYDVEALIGISFYQ